LALDGITAKDCGFTLPTSGSAEPLAEAGNRWGRGDLGYAPYGADIDAEFERICARSLWLVSPFA